MAGTPEMAGLAERPELAGNSDLEEPTPAAELAVGFSTGSFWRSGLIDCLQSIRDAGFLSEAGLLTETKGSITRPPE